MEGLMYRGLDYEIDYQKPVKVYRNLNNKKLSIIQNNKVVAYCDEIQLKDVTFHVQKAGLEKCRKEKRKNVHAYVKGYLFGDKVDEDYQIMYNPYKYDSFVDCYEVPLLKCNQIIINKKGLMFGN